MTFFLSTRRSWITGRILKDLVFFPVVLALGVFFWWGGLGPVWGAEEEAPCLDCHQAAWEKDLEKFYVHAPFREKSCRRCHVVGSYKESQTSALAPPQSAIEWFRRNQVPAREHWFAFAPGLVSDPLWLEIRSGNQRQNLQPVRLPPLASLPELADDGRPPQISRVEVEEVSLGVFVSVHISWETDEFADSSVLFGVGKLTEKSSSDFNLRQDHEMILSGLKKGREYLFSAVSEDVFGNRAVSAPLTFSTHRDLLAEKNPSDPYLLDSGNPDLTQRLRRAGDHYLLEVSARYPVVVSLGKNSSNRNGPHRLAQVPVSLNDSPHPPMQDEEVLNIHICFECHQNINEAMSHPVNILPPKGMIIPPEYPLLADGRMTCMSCHRRHGSDLPFRMIKSSRKELCIGCHVNY